MTDSEFSIHEVARLAGTTSRTLRHYGEVGILPPSRVGANGYRFYGADALVRLQRILLLRELGLGIPAIAEALGSDIANARALEAHLGWLEQERRRLDRQIVSVGATIAALDEGADPMTDQMFDGFDHTRYRDEVTERWGAEAYSDGDGWWRGLSREEQRAFQEEHRQIATDYAAAQAAGVAADDAAAQAIAARHVAWLGRSDGPGTAVPGRAGGQLRASRIRGLADLYVADPRFARNYGGTSGAEYVRAALLALLADTPVG